ncbi:arabinose phosphate phosphatase [Alsobacter metallidurans]|uniref:Inositol-1-monophosphatase n=1 Tax=Alsobacter metallidurans TaxID=340221 RepID=A0A917IAA1_9HYPH|nr:inositol monophosphatase [Alsobacter metallidurans]GGH31722.1 arabinose phosphate phosphatase [Alsobacter metallidurans]
MLGDIARLAQDAGEIALRHFERLGVDAVEAKGHLDLVTVADREAEAFITAGLAKLFPDDGVFGEEGASAQGRSGRLWVIDPIDGTFNFVRGGDQWAVSIGLYDKGRPQAGVIYAPVKRQTFAGGLGAPATLNGAPIIRPGDFDRSRGCIGVGMHPRIPAAKRLELLKFVMQQNMMIRCCGSSTVSLMELACGQVDGYVGVGESTWDVMAALPILASLGIESTLDWPALELSDKLAYACGSPPALDLVGQILPALI